MPENVTIAGALYRNPDNRVDSAYVPMPSELAYAVGHYTSQVMPMTVVRPAANSTGYYDLDFYGYAGRESHIPICAQGGAFPHSVVIDEAPAGATISNVPWDDDYLVLKFTPTANGSYQIRLRLYDAVGQLKVINYTYTVSETPFVFVSTTGNDTSGIGTKASPWATRSKAFATATGGKILILEDGTYTETTLGLSFTNSTINSIASWSPRGATIDLIGVSSTGTGVMIVTNTSHCHIQGIIHNNPPTTVANPRWYSCDNSSSYMYMDNCEFNNDGRVGTSNGDNISCWLLGGDTVTDRRYVAQTRCEFTGFAGVANGWSSIDTYGTSYLVIRSNKFSDQRSITTTAGLLWIKGSNNKNIDIKLNDFETPFGGGFIDLYMGNIVGANNASGNIDISFNLIRAFGVAGIWIARADQSGNRLPVWSRRNTIIGGSIIIFDKTFSVTVTSDSDVVECVESTTDPFKVFVRKDGAYQPLSIMPSLTATVTNYECHQGTGMVDANGILTGSYAIYRGTRGHEITRGM